jgi:putative adenylate-forming enzyme
MLPEFMMMASHFARARWSLNFRDREKLEAWQQDRLRRFMREVLPRAPYYRDLKADALADLPTMSKSTMMADFEALNTRGVSLDKAFEIAFKAETTRDFLPMLGDLTVGLSSGTSGNRGVFLVSPLERQLWAGILLGRTLPNHLLRRLLSLWQPRLRIAFFLRANSNLYTTLNSQRIAFDFHDLLAGIEPAVPLLNQNPPDVLVGPPSMLRALAAEAKAGHLVIAPSHVISVAEALEDNDRASVQAAFGGPVHQIYQATEGFLGYTCERGTLHLNESFVHIEPDWLDADHTRFQPIITDFTRETQLIVRYRLNDVLRVTEHPCACGRAERSVAAVEGRADEVLWLPAWNTGKAVAIFPDLIRRAMLFAGEAVREFGVTQEGTRLSVSLLVTGDREAAVKRVRAELDALWNGLGVMPPVLTFLHWQAPAPGVKRRRVRLIKAPEGLLCTF